MTVAHWVGVAFVAAAALQQPAAQPSGAADRQELVRLETVWNDSHVRGDADALDRLWADDLIVTVQGMRLLSKADSIAMLRSGRMRFEKYDTSDLRVRIYGDSAVVTGRLRRVRVATDRTESDDWHFTKVYVRQSGRWRVVAWHGSASPQ